jgi:hypothetical protein
MRVILPKEQIKEETSNDFVTTRFVFKSVIASGAKQSPLS